MCSIVNGDEKINTYLLSYLLTCEISAYELMLQVQLNSLALRVCATNENCAYGPRDERVSARPTGRSTGYLNYAFYSEIRSKNSLILL